MSDGKTSGIEPELYEKLVKEWDYEKNGRTRFEDYQRYFDLDAWWRCENGHSYKATIEDRIKGTGCRFCERNKAKHSITPLVSMKPQLVREWDYEKNDKRPEDYPPSSSEVVWWKCQYGHSWQASIYNRSRKANCPRCSRIKSGRSLLRLYPYLLNEWDYEKNELPPEAYTLGSTEKVWWKCKYGHSWQTRVCVRSQGCGCPICAHRELRRGVNDLPTIHPELVKEWDYEKNELPPEEYFSSSAEKVWWKCDKGHSWQASINCRSRGNGCPYCTHRRVERGVNDVPTIHPELVKEWDYEKNAKRPEDYSTGSHEKVWWKCENGHSWQADINHRSRGTGCPYCARSGMRKDS